MTAISSQEQVIELDRWSVPDLVVERDCWRVPPKERWRIDCRLRQPRSAAKSSMLYTRFSSHYLLIQRTIRKRELPEQVIDLTFVQEEPREVRDYRAGLWLAGALGLALAATLYWLLPALWLWWGIPVVIAVALMVIAVRGRRHVYEFRALNSQVVLFAIDAARPNGDRVGSFLAELREGVRRGQRELPVGRERIPLAVSEMRRLSEAGVITPAQYEQIKKNWFSI